MNSIHDISVDADYYYPRRFPPERKLMAAILERAILDIIRGSDKDKEDANLWIRGANDGTLGPLGKTGFSFREVCEFLDLDPLEFLEKIKTLKPETLSNNGARFRKEAPESLLKV